MLVGFNGRSDNLGDVLLHRCLTAELARRCSVDLLAPAPPGTVPAVRTRQALVRVAVARMRGRPVVLVDSPGAVLTPRRAASTTRWPWANRLRQGLVRRAWRALEPRRVRVGVSVDPAAAPSVAGRYHWIGVRDRTSLDAVRAHEPAAVYCPDLSFLLGPPPRRTGRPATVVLSFRAAVPDDGYHVGTRALLEARVPELVQVLAGQGLTCTFHSQVVEDEAFVAELAAASGVPCRRPVADLDDLLAAFAGVDVVISNRLHVLLVAAAQGALPVALVGAGHRKVRDLYRTVGWEALLVDPAGEAGEGPADSLIRLLAQAEPLSRLVETTFSDAGSLIRRRLAEMMAGPAGPD